MKKIFVLIFFILASASLMGQPVSQNWTVTGTLSNLGNWPVVSIVNSNVIFVSGGVANTPVVYMSTNGGLNWSDNLAGTLSGSPEIYCIYALSPTKIFLGDGAVNGGAGGNARLYTSNAPFVAYNIQYQTGGTNGFFNGIQFLKSNPLFGIAQSDPPGGEGQPYLILKTTDGGTSWTSGTAPGTPGAVSAANSVFIVDENFYGFGTNKGASHVCLTSNGGVNWIASNTGLGDGFLSGISFSSDKLRGIATRTSSTTYPRTIARTSNGGANWSLINTGTSITGSQVSFVKWVPTSDLVYVTADNGVMKSVNGGLNWTMTVSNASNNSIKHFDVLAENHTAYLFAINSAGQILKAVDTDVPLPVKLASFSSSVTGGNVSLKWETSEEINNSGFEIYRTVSGKDEWSKIGFVEGKGNKSTNTVYSYPDKNLNPGIYSYKLKQIDYNGNFEYFNLDNNVKVENPAKFSLLQNIPNPFNPSTVISFLTSTSGTVSVNIFDITGRLISSPVNGYLKSGYHEVLFDGTGLSSGIYFCKVSSAENSRIIRMMLMK